MEKRIRRCAWCGHFIKKAGNRRFCSLSHRNKFSYRKHNRKQWQRDYLQKRALASGKDLIQCQICKRWFRQVGSHIAQVHKMSARDYRAEYGFDVKRGQLPPDLRELKGGQVFENGTVGNLKSGKRFWFKKGQAGVGIYKRSPQTQERLNQQVEKYLKPYRWGNKKLCKQKNSTTRKRGKSSKSR